MHNINTIVGNICIKLCGKCQGARKNDETALFLSGKNTVTCVSSYEEISVDCVTHTVELTSSNVWSFLGIFDNGVVLENIHATTEDFICPNSTSSLN